MAMSGHAEHKTHQVSGEVGLTDVLLLQLHLLNTKQQCSAEAAYVVDAVHARAVE